MAKYLQVAEKAKQLIDRVMENIPKDSPFRSEVAADLAYLYNLGIRTSPRPTQSTVRLRAVQAAVKGQPLRVTLVEKEGRGLRGPYTFKAICIQPIGSSRSPLTDDLGPDDE